MTIKYIPKIKFIKNYGRKKNFPPVARSTTMN